MGLPSDKHPVLQICDYPLYWQMSTAEKTVLLLLLDAARSEVALEIGTYKGGSLQALSAKAGQVHTIDIDPEPAAVLGGRFPNVTFHTGPSAEQIPAVLGADTGVEDHLFGMAEHLELQAMVDAGMSPAQALIAATSRAAEYLHLDDRGSLVPGKRADLLVLDANPLDDIVNARRISRAFIHGVEIDRAALRAQIHD